MKDSESLALTVTQVRVLLQNPTQLRELLGGAPAAIPTTARVVTPPRPALPKPGKRSYGKRRGTPKPAPDGAPFAKGQNVKVRVVVGYQGAPRGTPRTGFTDLAAEVRRPDGSTRKPQPMVFGPGVDAPLHTTSVRDGVVAYVGLDKFVIGQWRVGVTLPGCNGMLFFPANEVIG